MTRINTLDPANLTDQHLLAEYRELPRVFSLVALAIAAGKPLTGPARYTMGAGHVRFFYSRTDYLSARQAAIIAEIIRRGYNPTHREAPAPIGPPSAWMPDAADVEVNLCRLRERLREAPRAGFYTFWGRAVGADFYDAACPPIFAALKNT